MSEAFEVDQKLYAGRVEEIRAQVGVPINARFAGQYFVNARFRRIGKIPGGITWSSDPQGIRFSGTPTDVGIFEALFEGPYPNNFVGVTSWGDYTVDQCRPESQTVNPGIQSVMVYGWIVRFLLDAQDSSGGGDGNGIPAGLLAVTGVDFGRVWRSALKTGNPIVYRGSWGALASVPGAPRNLFSLPADESITIRFTAPISDGGAAITGYEYQLDDGAWGPLTVDFAQSPLSGVIPNLENDRNYVLRLRAVNSAGAGAAVSLSIKAGALVFSTMRLVGSEASMGAWAVESSAVMLRNGAPNDFDWTVVVAVSDPATAVFKFAVGVAGINPWDDPNTPVVENWGELDLPGTEGYFIGDAGSSVNMIFSQAVPGGAAGQYRFSFNETTYAWAVSPVG